MNIKTYISRFIVLIGLSFISFGVFCQDSKGVKKIVTFNFNDTLAIQHFNIDGNLVFHKIFPQFGVSQILGYNYIGGKKVSYTWSHSNVGFAEMEYEYDSLKNTLSTYSYHKEGRIPIKNLMSYHKISSLKLSKEFKNYSNPDLRYLKSIQYMQDSLVVKKDEYSENSQIEKTTLFTYNEGKLTLKKKVDKADKNWSEEFIYEYDQNGNETKWAKVYKSIDTSIYCQKRYEQNRLIEEIFYVKSDLDSKTIYEYSKNDLKSKKQFNNKGELKISSDYEYREDGRIDFINEVNNYMGHKKKILYYY